MKKINHRLNNLEKSTKLIILLIVWCVFATIFYLAFRENKDPQTVIHTIASIIIYILYFPSPFFIFVILYILIRRKNKGEGKPLSIEAMRESRRHIPDKIYKFVSLSMKDTNNKSENGLNDNKLKSLENNQIWLTSGDCLNDPYEGITCVFPDQKELENLLKEDKEKQNLLLSIKEKLTACNPAYTQASFSKDFHNTLMWGYYANGCRGYCIEYEVKDKEYLFSAQYLNRRIFFDGLSANRNIKQNMNKNLINFKSSLDKCSSLELIQYMLYLKSFKNKEWDWEQEIRVISYGIADLAKGYNEKIDLLGLSISKIIIGFRCDYKQELIRIAEKLKIPYSIMEPSFADDKYRLTESTFET